jgi:amidophosphoribosyltransferase
MCGVVGVYGHEEAATLIYLGLHALQHRGQESAGIATWDGEALHSHRQMGQVQDIFSRSVLANLEGKIGIGHVRYSTTGQSILKNAQPIVVEYLRGPIALAHNGNLVNAHSLRHTLESDGSIFQSTMDSEVIVHLIARGRHERFEDNVLDALRAVRGAYSVVIQSEGVLIAARDPLGFRPLVLGKLGEALIVASETTALDLIEAKYIRDVRPGELLIIDETGMRSEIIASEESPRPCVFEHIYFARPDSIVFGENVYPIRRAFGRKLAAESPADADVVIPVPDSGVPAAIGFAEASGIPFQMGLIRSHYVGRTFIEPSQNIRSFGVRLKLNPVPEVIAGKRVIVIDDSIVRGTTSRKIIRMLREAGAREVHLRISSPPTTNPCYYGIDTPDKSQLIASNLSVAEISAYLGTDSLAYLSLEGLLETAGKGEDRSFCHACFSGQYPVPVLDEIDPRQMRLFEH